MKEAIYLAGGGDEHQSANFDALFLKGLQSREISKLIYIPVALRVERVESAEKWFRNIFAGKGLEIETWTDLGGLSMDPSELSLYIGGGDTVQLLSKIRGSGFDKRLIEFVRSGGVVYGGSAGAIVLGADIRTAPEARNILPSSSHGLDLLNGLSVACHFKGTDEEIKTYRRLRKEIDTPIIAISELGGVIVEQSEMKVFDKKEVAFF